MTSEKILLVNWSNREEGTIGGCETLFDIMSKKLGLNTEIVTFRKAAEILGVKNFPEYHYDYANIDRSYLITEAIENREKVGDKIDLIISNDGCVPFLKTNIPIISIIQNPYMDIANWMKLSRYYVDVRPVYQFGKFYLDTQRLQAQKSLKSIANSEFMADYCKRYSIPCTNTIPLGVDMELFKSMDKQKMREKFSIPQDKIVAVWSGSVHPLQGYHIMLELAKEHKDDMHFIFVNKQMWSAQDKAKTLSNITYLDMVPYETMPEIYNCGDVYMLPTPIQSFSLTAAEALACNVPIIHGKAGFAWHWGDGESGYFMKRCDIEAYRWALGEFLKQFKEDPKFFKARQIAKEADLSIDVCIGKWKDLINGVLQKA